MIYTVEISPAAQRQLNKLPETIRLSIFEAIVALGANPRPVGVKKILG